MHSVDSVVNANNLIAIQILKLDLEEFLWNFLEPRQF